MARGQVLERKESGLRLAQPSAQGKLPMRAGRNRCLERSLVVTFFAAEGKPFETMVETQFRDTAAGGAIRVCVARRTDAGSGYSAGAARVDRRNGAGLRRGLKSGRGSCSTVSAADISKVSPRP